MVRLPPQLSVIPADRGARTVFVCVVLFCGVVISIIFGNVLPVIAAALLAGWCIMWSLINQRIAEGPRRLPHECKNCGYDRRGIPSVAPCPECGSAA